MVILKEDNVRLLQWPIGWIRKVSSGQEEYVRVATIVFKRKI